MNTSFYHRILEERRSQFRTGGFDDIFNGIVVENPFDAIDCTPDTGFDNFQRTVKGDNLVYAEIANSTPFEGHVVKQEFAPLVKLNARTSCVFSNADIARMRRKVVGTRILQRHGGFYPMGENGIGKVIDASILTGKFLGEKYKTLCILCWIDHEFVEKRTRNSLLYLSFGIKISNETCCKCGKSSSVSSPCHHIKDNSADSSLSICAFDHFNAIELSSI